MFPGIYWVVNGVIEIFAALAHREMPSRGWSAVMGILSILEVAAVFRLRKPTAA